MTIPIPVSASLTGRLADAPRLRETGSGTVYVRVRVHVFPRRPRHAGPDASWPEPVTVELVTFDAVATVLCQRFRFGDWFVASGRLEASRSNAPVSFIARRIGHDATRTSYTLRRSRPRPVRARSTGPALQPAGSGTAVDRRADDRSA
ncbi:hypothetical protein [Myceligenerans crystallogenes]|uniref:Single-strand DNA-binding protein n=1 Tax=Myceligenerans crystallogenes TaxID=316335 RepID=A0ABP4ZF70_9MICO